MEDDFQLFDELVNVSGADIRAEDEVLALKNETLVELYENFGISHEQFKTFPRLKKIIENHIIDEIKKNAVKMVSGEEFDYVENKSVDGIELRETFEIEGKTYILFDEILLTDEDRKKLGDFLEKDVKRTFFSKLPLDVLQHIAGVGKLSGVDLINLCDSDANARRICEKDDFKIFRSKLSEDYGMDYDKSEDKNQYNPMELYQSKIYDIGFIRVYKNSKHNYQIQYFRENKISSKSELTSHKIPLSEIGVFDFFPERPLFTEINDELIEWYLIFEENSPKETASLIMREPRFYKGKLQRFSFEDFKGTARMLTYLRKKYLAGTKLANADNYSKFNLQTFLYRLFDVIDQKLTFGTIKPWKNIDIDIELVFFKFEVVL